jgi:hypothetical protein
MFSYLNKVVENKLNNNDKVVAGLVNNKQITNLIT